MAERLRVIAKREALGLHDLEIFRIENFDKEIRIPITKILGTAEEQTQIPVQDIVIIPEGTTPVPPEPEPEPEPIPPEPPTPEPSPEGEVLYNSLINSNLHDGKERTISKEGNIAPNGLGVECHASGNPRIKVNSDKTFSLLCDAGHGRFYLFVLNYNATLEIICAFWNAAAGQDLSTKMRSRHNEGSACENRFGGYGCAIDRSGYDAKREICHNIHDQSKSGSLPGKIETQKYFTLRFTVKDDAGKVKQTASLDGKQFMDKIDIAPKPYMIDQESFKNQSYLWIRQNITSGTGEIRIKQIRVLKA